MDRMAIEDVLFQAVETVLETAALTWAEETVEDYGLDQWERAIAVRMDFDGHTAGFVALAVPEELGAVLAANMVGADEDPDAEAVDAVDAVKELLNMIGMIVAESLFEGEEVLVSPPREIPFSEYREHAACDAGMEKARVGVATEDSVMELLLMAEEGRRRSPA